MNDLKVLLVGYGKLAQGLVPELNRLNIIISAIKRSKSVATSCCPSVKFYYCDLCQFESIKEINFEFDVIVVTLTPDGKSDEDYRETYLVTMQHLTRLLKNQKSNARILYVSSTRIYGQNDGSWIDEKSETKPSEQKGEYLLEAENIVLNHNHKNVIVRFSGIYGNGRNHLIESVKRGYRVSQNLPYYTNRIHEDDCIQVMAFLLNKMLCNERLDNIYLASDDKPESIEVVTKWIADQNEYPNIALTEKIRGQSLKGKRCSNSRLKQLGYSFKFPDYTKGYIHKV